VWVRDRLDGLWQDEDFAGWYSRDGRPGLSPAQLATVSVLQFVLNLSDRQAAEAVRCRTGFKCALGLEGGPDSDGLRRIFLQNFLIAGGKVRPRTGEDGLPPTSLRIISPTICRPASRCAAIPAGPGT